MQELESSEQTPSSPKFYRGIVVDNNDPEKYGRVRVKLFGLNDQEANDNLPWAEVMQPTGLGLISGVGLSAVLKQGTWVYVILEENNPEKPIVIGVSTGINELRSDGFSDPDNIYPLPLTLGQSDFGQCNINDFSLENKGLTDTTITSHGVMFNYQTDITEDSYRDSWILRSEKGLVLEIDDHNEQLKITHPTGTYVVIDKEGSVKVSSQKNIVLNAKKDLEFNVLGDFKVNVDGSVKCDIMKDFNLFCNQGLNWNVNQNVNLAVKQSINEIVGQDINETVEGSVNVKGSKISFKSQDYEVSSVNVKFSTQELKTNSSRLSVNTNKGLVKGANVITKERLNLSTHRHRRNGKPKKPS